VEVGRREAGWEHGPLGGGEQLKAGGEGEAWAEGGAARAVIDSIAQPLDRASPGKAGHGLRDGGKGEILEIPHPPHPFASRLDPLLDEGGCPLGGLKV